MYPETHIARARLQTYFDPDFLLHQFKKVMSLLHHVLLIAHSEFWYTLTISLMREHLRLKLKQVPN